MSQDKEAVDTSSCASCGIAEKIDDIKLTECANCDLVRYCGDDCQRDHRPKHMRACRERVAELRDELLFKQPESRHVGDCPICMLPLPHDETKSTMMSCCSKEICNGCYIANLGREAEESLDLSCPFCRKRIPVTKEEQSDIQRMIRIKANDPVALRHEGVEQYKKGDYKSAFDYVTKAAELGNVEALLKLALMYHEGHGVEKDEGKSAYHLEEAAIGGHPKARYFLGVNEWENNDNAERAVKHWIIAANQGDDYSIEVLMEAFKNGCIEKDKLAAALRAHQAAVDATKSPQRDAADEFERSWLERGV